MQKFIFQDKWTLMLLLVCCFSSACSDPIARALEKPSGFKGRILAASDADMLGGAYADGVLNKVEGVEDSLSLLEVRGGDAHIISQHFASNSVISWPAILAWNPTDQMAYVAETRAPFTGTEKKVDDVWQDIPSGKELNIYALSAEDSIVLVQTKQIGQDIQGVSLNYNNSLLAAGSTEKGKELVLASLSDGLITQLNHQSYQGIAPSSSNNSEIKTVEFHPNENILAVNLNSTHLIFYQCKEADGQTKLEQLGPSIEVGKNWSVGNWHPSGKYFILTDVAWGNGNLGYVTNGKGKLVSVKFDQEGEHEIVSEVKVGLSPEGFDLSPDGKYAITVNMRRTYMPPEGYWFVGKKDYASLSLISIDPATGKMTKIRDDYGFEGMLPEDAVFDLESNSIAVAIFHDRADTEPRQGWIDFWELEGEKLVKTNRRIMLTRGVHNLLLLK